MASNDAPDGRDHWTLLLLADKVVELGFAALFSHEAVRDVFQKRPQAVAKRTAAHPERRIPKVSAAFVAAMEDVLDLYEEAYDETRLAVCFDERVAADVVDQDG